MPRFRRLSLLNRLIRVATHRLIVPLKRNPHPPEYSARGVLVGLFWGLTPTVGIQIAAVLVTWIVGRRLFGWNFSLILAVVWTGVTNPLTMLPLYYLFYMTGQVLLGRWGDLTGYQAFASLFTETSSSGMSLVEMARLSVSIILKDWGLALVVGALPYAVIAAALGYAWGLRFIIRYRAARAARQARKRQRRAQQAGT